MALEKAENFFLIRPELLSSTYALSISSQEKLSRVLQIFLGALAETSDEKALQKLDRALEILEPLNAIEPDKINSTHNGLQAWEIQEYDNFFGLSHVQTKQPADCLLASIILAYRTLLELNIRDSTIPEHSNIETLKIGFKSSAKLLMRTFNLLEDRENE